MSMWNKKEEPPAPRPASAPPAPSPVPIAAEIKKETTPVSSTPFRNPDPEPRSNAMIGKSVKVNGKIFTKEDLYVDGDVEGTIESQDNKVTIGPNGRVQADIGAREVIILGQVQGNVIASDKVDIRKDAKLVGDIVAACASASKTAYALFKGSIDIKKPEPKASTPAPAPSSAAAHPVPVVAVGAAGGPRT